MPDFEHYLDHSQHEAMEGVIKFKLAHHSTPPISHPGLAELNAFRTLFFRLGLTGQDPLRYDGLGYGNFSIREGTAEFLISASQTGGIPELGNEHYVRIIKASPEEHTIKSEGPLPPSSETMTHASIYQASPSTHCVMHVHDPLIWQESLQLGLESTAQDIPYGSREMAIALGGIAARHPEGVIAMQGHLDGVIAFGGSISETARLLIEVLAKAVALRGSIQCHALR
jgi:hypothetical protein